MKWGYSWLEHVDRFYLHGVLLTRAGGNPTRDFVSVLLQFRRNVWSRVCFCLLDECFNSVEFVHSYTLCSLNARSFSIPFPRVPAALLRGVRVLHRYSIGGTGDGI